MLTDDVWDVLLAGHHNARTGFTRSRNRVHRRCSKFFNERDQ
jgi:hypothetical protein